MNVLGVETSCDETALAIVKDGKKIISHSLFSSLRFHRRYGGIIPEIASRYHLESIHYLFKSLFKKADLSIKDIDLVAVTAGPGLLGSLLVGVSFAKAMAYSLSLPLIGIDHLHGHLYPVFLDPQYAKKIKFPFVGLVVSGGHTNLFYVKDFLSFQKIGITLDDACGEALDKIARLLGLGYPGGPFIERLAQKGKANSIKFPVIKTENPLDFSFSGIKTAVIYFLKDKGYREESFSRLPFNLKKDLCAAFQETLFDYLVKKSFLACQIKKSRQLVIGGGVAVNRYLRQKFQKEAQEQNLEVYFSPSSLCLDNAVMIAGLGYVLFKKGRRDGWDLRIYTD